MVNRSSRLAVSAALSQPIAPPSLLHAGAAPVFFIGYIPDKDGKDTLLPLRVGRNLQWVCRSTE